MSQKMIWAQKYYERDISCSEMPKNDRMWFEKREKKKISWSPGGF